MFKRRSPTIFACHTRQWLNLYHQRRLPNFHGCCHCWPNLHKYGAVNIDDDNTYGDDGWLVRRNMIIGQTSIKWWLHAPCYWDIWLFSSSFWFISDYLCIDHYCISLVIFFSPFNAYFLLSTMCVHSLATCISHSDFLLGYDIWLGFFISSKHHS